MKSTASAPGKIILFGEHFVVYGVKAILCAINKRITVTSEITTEKTISIKSEVGELNILPKTDLNQIDSPLKPLYYIADFLISKNNSEKGIKIDVKSDIPIGVGLGSSSALCVAGAGSLSKLFGEVSKEEILKLAIDAEKTIFQDTSGADCTVCTFGGIIQYDKENGFSRLDSKPNFDLVIANSDIIHSTKQIVSKVSEYKEKNQEMFEQLCKNEEKLVDNVFDQLNSNDLISIGKFMIENQQYLKRIGVSNNKLQEIIYMVKDYSFGAKLTGAGGGGCIIALTDSSNKEAVLEKLYQNNIQCFSVKIDFQGLDTF